METPELIHAAQQGNLQAFNHLVLEYQDTIYNLVCRLLASESSAEAVTQSVVMHLYRELPAYRSGDFRIWLLKVLVKVCRQSLAHPLSHLQLPLEGQHLQATDELVMQRSLWSLPPDLRFSLVLVDLEGLDYAQAAAVLGIPRQTIQNRLAKARLTLSEGYQYAYG